MLTNGLWKSMKYYTTKQFYPSYKSHKKHHHYKLTDIGKVDPTLVSMLQHTAEHFGYAGTFT